MIQKLKGPPLRRSFLKLFNLKLFFMKKILTMILLILGKVRELIKRKRTRPSRKVYRFVEEPKKRKQPSLKQLEQVAKFKMTMQLLKPMFEFLPVTYRNVSGRTTARNKAFSYNIRHAIKGDFPNLSIDHEAVRVSKGNLYNSSSSIAYVSKQKIHFSWNNLQINNAKDDDIAVLVAYCPARKKCIYTTTGPRRDEEKAVLDVKQFKSHIVHAYLSFVSANGNLVADSKYSGRFTIN
jgi:hypothetical protein